jgi:hypothetical protein
VWALSWRHLRARSRPLPIVVLAALLAAFAAVALPERLHAGAAASPRACTLYASPRGADGAAGTRRQPFRTVQRLADSLGAGQTGCLRGGSYNQVSSGGYVLRARHGGSRGSPITIRSYPGERATLVGIVYVPKGASNVTLTALTIVGTGGQNTIQVHAADVIVQDNDITNNWKGNSCLILGDNSGSGQALRPIVRRNRFHECGSPANSNHDHGIYVGNALDGQIVDNLFWNMQAYAIHLYPNAQHTEVAHNVIDGDYPSIRGGVLFGGDTNWISSNNTVEYNIISYAQTYNIESWWGGSPGTGNVARYNCLWAGKQGNINTSGGGFTTSNITIADPVFVNKANHDYRLAAGSPCLSVVGYDTAAKLG